MTLFIVLEGFVARSKVLFCPAGYFVAVLPTPTVHVARSERALIRQDDGAVAAQAQHARVRQTMAPLAPELHEAHDQASLALGRQRHETEIGLRLAERRAAEPVAVRGRALCMGHDAMASVPLVGLPEDDVHNCTAVGIHGEACGVLEVFDDALDEHSQGFRTDRLGADGSGMAVQGSSRGAEAPRTTSAGGAS